MQWSGPRYTKWALLPAPIKPCQDPLILFHWNHFILFYFFIFLAQHTCLTLGSSEYLLILNLVHLIITIKWNTCNGTLSPSYTDALFSPKSVGLFAHKRTYLIFICQFISKQLFHLFSSNRYRWLNCHSYVSRLTSLLYNDQKLQVNVHHSQRVVSFNVTNYP